MSGITILVSKMLRQIWQKGLSNIIKYLTLADQGIFQSQNQTESSITCIYTPMATSDVENAALPFCPLCWLSSLTITVNAPPSEHTDYSGFKQMGRIRCCALTAFSGQAHAWNMTDQLNLIPHAIRAPVYTNGNSLTWSRYIASLSSLNASRKEAEDRVMYWPTWKGKLVPMYHCWSKVLISTQEIKCSSNLCSRIKRATIDSWQTAHIWQKCSEEVLLRSFSHDMNVSRCVANVAHDGIKQSCIRARPYCPTASGCPHSHWLIGSECIMCRDQNLAIYSRVFESSAWRMQNATVIRTAKPCSSASRYYTPRQRAKCRWLARLRIHNTMA